MRVVIEAVAPAVHEGRFAIRRAVGDVVLIEADCFADGHDKVAACLIWRKEGASQWHEAPMRALGNDRWSG
ncbi:MAG: maltotransferase domain-containing protein, partial [Gammaproteobacteria bacterium]